MLDFLSLFSYHHRSAAILFCAGSSWLPLSLASFPSFSLFPTPNRPCQSERSPEARHEADSFEPAEWSERLTPGQLGWLGAATVHYRFDSRSRSFSKSEQKLLLFLEYHYFVPYIFLVITFTNPTLFLSLTHSFSLSHTHTLSLSLSLSLLTSILLFLPFSQPLSITCFLPPASVERHFSQGGVVKGRCHRALWPQSRQWSGLQRFRKCKHRFGKSWCCQATWSNAKSCNDELKLNWGLFELQLEMNSVWITASFTFNLNSVWKWVESYTCAKSSLSVSSPIDSLCVCT